MNYTKTFFSSVLIHLELQLSRMVKCLFWQYILKCTIGPNCFSKRLQYETAITLQLINAGGVYWCFRCFSCKFPKKPVRFVYPNFVYQNCSGLQNRINRVSVYTVNSRYFRITTKSLKTLPIIALIDCTHNWIITKNY